VWRPLVLPLSVSFVRSRSFLHLNVNQEDSRPVATVVVRLSGRVRAGCKVAGTPRGRSHLCPLRYTWGLPFAPPCVLRHLTQIRNNKRSLCNPTQGHSGIVSTVGPSRHWFSYNNASSDMGGYGMTPNVIALMSSKVAMVSRFFHSLSVTFFPSFSSLRWFYYKIKKGLSVTLFSLSEACEAYKMTAHHVHSTPRRVLGRVFISSKITKDEIRG
jgi:hypothetical protein